MFKDNNVDLLSQKAQFNQNYESLGLPDFPHIENDNAFSTIFLFIAN